LHEYTSFCHVGVIGLVVETPSELAISGTASPTQIIFDDTDGDAPGVYWAATAPVGNGDVVLDDDDLDEFDDDDPQAVATRASAASAMSRVRRNIDSEITGGHP
jgi:hypothetical protein